MPLSGKLLAWIAPRGDDAFLAAFGAAEVPGRAPATQLCSSPAEARQWIEGEAAALGLPVAWVGEAPRER
jgi:hypothetical protein